MKINEIKSEADFNIYKNGKNGAVLFTEVLSYLLAHVNSCGCSKETSCDSTPEPKEPIPTKSNRPTNANQRQNKKA